MYEKCHNSRQNFITTTESQVKLYAAWIRWQVQHERWNAGRRLLQAATHLSSPHHPASRRIPIYNTQYTSAQSSPRNFVL